MDWPKITIKAEEAGNDPSILIYSVELDRSGVWRETFGSEEHLLAFIRGLKAAYGVNEDYLPDPEIPRRAGDMTVMDRHRATGQEVDRNEVREVHWLVYKPDIHRFRDYAREQGLEDSAETLRHMLGMLDTQRQADGEGMIAT